MLIKRKIDRTENKGINFVSKKLITYHVTPHDENDFKDGIWPLTHFGPPAMGVWQTISKNIGGILAGNVTLKIMEVEILFNNKIETEDSGTSNIWGFLMSFFKSQGMNQQLELTKTQHLYKDHFKTDKIDNRSIRTKEARSFAANICLEKGYDLSFYKNEVEYKALKILKDFSQIPKIDDDNCYINMNYVGVKQFKIIKEIGGDCMDKIINEMKVSCGTFSQIYSYEAKQHQ